MSNIRWDKKSRKFLKTKDGRGKKNTKPCPSSAGQDTRQWWYNKETRGHATYSFVPSWKLVRDMLQQKSLKRPVTPRE
jgi:hypothetical protein